MTIYADYAAAFSALVADAQLVRREGALAKPPAKGIRRSALVGGWLALHIFELVVLAVYGAFRRGPYHATWWLLTSLLAGILYVRVAFSDPGFMDAAILQRLAEEVGLTVTVAGTDASRGLLADVEATLPRMQELLPAEEQSVGELPLTATHDPTRGACSRARVVPTDSSAPSSSTDAVEVELEEVIDPGELLHADAAKNEEEEEKVERLKRALSYTPRIVGIVEAGQAEAMAEMERQRQERLNKPLGLEDYFRRARSPSIVLPTAPSPCVSSRPAFAVGSASRLTCTYRSAASTPRSTAASLQSLTTTATCSATRSASSIMASSTGSSLRRRAARAVLEAAVGIVRCGEGWWWLVRVGEGW